MRLLRNVHQEHRDSPRRHRRKAIGMDCAAAIGVERHVVARRRALRNKATQGAEEIETIRTWVAEADTLGTFRPASFEYVTETLAALEAGARATAHVSAGAANRWQRT